jgi:hypothetical protein
MPPACDTSQMVSNLIQLFLVLVINSSTQTAHQD